MKENNLIKTVKNFGGVIIVLMAFHYFLSYRVLFLYLNHFSLSVQSVISIEDLMFDFGELNFSVVKLILIGLSIVACAKLLLPVIIYEQIDVDTFKSFKYLLNNVGIIAKAYFNSGFWVKLLLGIFFISTAVVISLSNFKEINLEPKLLFLLISIYLLLPIAYILFSSKRTIIMGFYLSAVFIASNLIVEELVKEVVTTPSDYRQIISFQYHGKKVSTNNDIGCVFQGYKTIVLHNTKNKENCIYEKSDITFLSTTKIKLD